MTPPPQWQALGEAEACDASARRFRARAMTMTPLVGTAACYDVAGADLSLLNGGRCPVLLDHNRAIRDVVGVIECAWVEAGAVNVIARMGHGEAAETAWQNIQAGIWRNVSVGNTVQDMEREGDGYRIRQWQPHELSLVWSGWCPDAQIDDTGRDLARLHREVAERRRARAERDAEAAAKSRASLVAGMRSRYRLTALELAAELRLPAAEAEAAAERIAERMAAELAGP